MKNSFKEYYSWRPNLCTGDLLEWDSDTILGNGIQWFTGKDVNHTSMIIRFSNFDTERVYVMEALAKGLYPNLLSRRLEYFKGRVYWLQLNPNYNDYRSALAREIMKYVGTKYDYRSLFKQAFSRVSVQVDAFFCSEAIYAAILESKILEAYQLVLYAAEKMSSSLIKPKTLEYAPHPGEFSSLGIYRRRICIYDSNSD